MIMMIYKLTIILHDPIFWATREIGRLYLTESYLHNYAISYALGLINSEYHDEVQIPRYREDLTALNERGIYATPARPVSVEYLTHTFKLADIRSHVEMMQSSHNIPTYGKTRELAPESRFEAYLIAKRPAELPNWIRLGKRMGKAEVVRETMNATSREGSYIVKHPMNPLDLPREPELYDLINMPPVSLVNNCRLEGRYWRTESVDLPVDLAYRFPE